jgi:hypothetical protein
MTITETGRRTREQLIEQARSEIAGGPLPSRTALAKSLKTHFTIASEVHEVLSKERRREAARAHKARRLEGPKKRAVKASLITPAPPFTAPSETPAEPVPEVVADVVVKRRPKSWPLVVLTFPAMVAIWGGWVDMGRLTGFGVVHPFPGIPGLDDVAVNLAITLPVSLETYAAYALYVWLSGQVPAAARRFAKRSAIGGLAFGAAGQVAYHLMSAAGMSRAPWQITTVVACLPVAVLGMGAALRHLVHAEEE